MDGELKWSFLNQDLSVIADLFHNVENVSNLQIECAVWFVKYAALLLLF